VRIQELGRDVAAPCRARYATAYGSFDAYVPFIERGLTLLRGGGRLGFIVPSAFLKLDYGRRLRARLAHDQAVKTIVDFGHAQIFEGATNYTCVLILERAGVPELSLMGVRGTSAEVRRAVASRELPEPERYTTGAIGSRAEKQAANHRFRDVTQPRCYRFSRRVGNASSAVGSARIRGRT